MIPHVKHHTEAIVLCGTPSGEAHKFFYLLTKDFGLVVAHARSVRSMQSKLRYSMQDFSHIQADLVHGKSGWRITSAIHIKSFCTTCDAADHALPVISRVSNLLRRLLKGEEKNEPLFIDVALGFALLSSSGLNKEDVRSMEAVLVMRILNHLGYWGDDSALAQFLTGDIGNGDHIAKIKEQKRRAIGAINEALQETQL